MRLKLGAGAHAAGDALEEGGAHVLVRLEVAVGVVANSKFFFFKKKKKAIAIYRASGAKADLQSWTQNLLRNMNRRLEVLCRELAGQGGGDRSLFVGWFVCLFIYSPRPRFQQEPCKSTHASVH